MCVNVCPYVFRIYVYVVLFFSSILTHDGSVHGLERDRVFLYDDSTHVLSFDQLRKVGVCTISQNIDTTKKFMVVVEPWKYYFMK